MPALAVDFKQVTGEIAGGTLQKLPGGPGKQLLRLGA